MCVCRATLARNFRWILLLVCRKTYENVWGENSAESSHIRWWVVFGFVFNKIEFVLKLLHSQAKHQKCSVDGGIDTRERKKSLKWFLQSHSKWVCLLPLPVCADLRKSTSALKWQRYGCACLRKIKFIFGLQKSRNTLWTDFPFFLLFSAFRFFVSLFSFDFNLCDTCERKSDFSG